MSSGDEAAAIALLKRAVELDSSNRLTELFATRREFNYFSLSYNKYRTRIKKQNIEKRRQNILKDVKFLMLKSEKIKKPVNSMNI